MPVITISLPILSAITLFQVIRVLKTLNNSLQHLQFNNHSHSVVDDSAGGRILTADRAAELKEARFKWIPYWQSVSVKTPNIVLDRVFKRDHRALRKYWQSKPPHISVFMIQV